ncbi:holo-ACP synthase [Streptomyces sp. NBC_01335]|uniref:holo-ACP synthase n=1 Tax=Streptomyces sp. NBC_01335 TaxID=2903828 RepID=UPI002E167FF2|nr:holo-ACP synthase [Streptomyces sp. NBC_01335]
MPPHPAARPGVDILGVDELDRLITRSWFLEFAYSPWERGYADSLGPARRQEFLAARFAAKEAVVKAIGRGAGRAIAPRHIEIGRRADGSPVVRLLGRAADHAATTGIGSVAVSIAHKKGVAIAVAIAHPLLE